MCDLIIKNLCKSFGEEQVLKDYSVEIESGKLVWLRAESGAGKTTLFRIISGLEKADSGEVSFDGEVVYCFQEDRLIDGLSAVDNILAVISGGTKKNAFKKAYEKKVDVIEIIKSHLAELGLTEEDISKPVSELSGGMKRRVALARAVCYMTICVDGKAKLLLLDEPFTGLDAANREKAMNYAIKHTAAAIVLIASHEMVENNGDFIIETAYLD